MTQTFNAPTRSTDEPTEYFDYVDRSVRVLAEVAANFAAHEAAAPNMTVVLDSGKMQNGIVLTTKTAQTTTAITAPSVDPRIDRIVIDNTTAVYSIVTGAENVSPVAPAIPADKTTVCQIALVVSQTSILNADITDERPGIIIGGAGGAPVYLDSEPLSIGTSDDLQLEHDGSDSYVTNRFAGDLIVKNNVASGDVLVQGGTSGRVLLSAGGSTRATFASDGTWTLGTGGDINTIGSDGATGHYTYGRIASAGQTSYNDTATPTTAYAADLLSYSSFELTMGGNTAITFSNMPSAFEEIKVRFVLIQDATGSRVPSFPASVKWPGGTVPTWGTTSGDEDVIELVTYDAGTTWRANLVGQNYA